MNQPPARKGAGNAVTALPAPDNPPRQHCEQGAAPIGGRP